MILFVQIRKTSQFLLFLLHKFFIYNIIMQQKTQQSKVSLKVKQPFLLKINDPDKPRKVFSLNRLNYPEDLQKHGTITAKRDIIEHEFFQHHLVQKNMKIQSELKKLQVAFVHEKIPEFYGFHFMNRLVHASEQIIEDKIIKQLEEVKNKRSFYHVTINTIKAREGCLKQLQRCVENLYNNQDDNLTKHIFRQQILHYRKLTTFVIAHIRSWKSYLNDVSSEIQFTTFLYQNEDYLLKILNDCQFVFNSFLSKFLKFSYRNDPYIMRPYADGNGQKYMEIFSYTEQEKTNFMIDLNYLATERAKYLTTKMSSKNQKMKEIERIYQNKEAPLSSRILIRKIPSGDQKKRISEEKQPKVNNFLVTTRSESVKQLKIEQIEKKSEKIRKIKQAFGRTSSNKIINENMFQTVGGQRGAGGSFQQKLRYGQFGKKSGKYESLNMESDFENLLRKKQLDALKGGDNFEATKTQKSFKNVKIKDNLAESHKFISNEDGYNELEKIVNQLETFSPQKLSDFRLRKKEDLTTSNVIRLNQGKPFKSRVIEPTKTLLQHNEEVYVSVRNQVIKEIEKDFEDRQKLQQKNRQQNEQIQALLQKKIREQSLKILGTVKQKRTEGRQILAKDMQSSNFFGYQDGQVKNSEKLTLLEQQLKKQMQLKWLRQVQQELKRKTEFSQLQSIKQKQDKELDKQLAKIKQKQELQKRYEQIERQQRSKAVQKQIQLDEQRKKEIEEQMKKIIEREKEEMERFAISQKIKVENELRQAMKEELLDNLKQQKQQFYDDNKKERQIIKKESEYREQVREKIEQEYKIGQQMKKNRERQQKVAKIRLVKEKLGEVESKVRQTFTPQKNQQKRNQNQKQEELKKSMVKDFPDFRESILPKYKKNNQQEKKKLREQFELELFAFRRPEGVQQANQKEENKMSYEQGKFPIKDFRKMINEDMKQFEKQKQKQGEGKNMQNEKDEKEKEEDNLEVIQIQNLKQSKKNNQSEHESMDKTVRSSDRSQRFTKFSQNQIKRKADQDQLIRLKLGMTFDQYKVYKKKKQLISTRRDKVTEELDKKQRQEGKKVVQFIDQFEKLTSPADNKQKRVYGGQNQIDLEIDKMRSNSKSQSRYQGQRISQQEENKNKKYTQIDMMNENEEKDKIKTPMKNKQESRGREKREEKKDRKIKDQSFDEFIDDGIDYRKKSEKIKKFATSDEDQYSSDYIKRGKGSKNKNVAKNKGRNNKNIEKQDSQTRSKRLKKGNKEQQNAPFIENNQDQGIGRGREKKTIVKIRQIPISSISQFFTDHFQHLPKLIKRINIYKKEELIKFILDHSSFTILQYIKQSVSVGIGIILYNQNKNKYRSLDIAHLGSYDELDYFELLISIVKYCFKNDPCEQITMSNIYDREISDQWEFIKQLQKKFDPYGAIFQKKIFNTQFERKFVLRRTIGEVCKYQPDKTSNRGNLQLHINTFITQSKNEEEVSLLKQADQYDEIGFNIGFYGIIGHYLSQKCSEQKLAYLITKSTSKDATNFQKCIASLAKLSLAMKKNPSFQRLSELSEQKFQNIMNLNLRLLQKNEPVIPYDPESIENPLNCLWQSFNTTIQINYSFYIQNIPISISQNNQDQTYLCKYLRYTPTKKNKMYILNSTAYSSKITVFPCKENKYKIFILDSHEFEDLLKNSEKNSDRIEIGVYLKVFFANIADHQVADYDYVWIPETDIDLEKNHLTNLDYFREKKNEESQQHFRSGVIRSSFNHTYNQYLGNSLKFSPSHRDLLITPPFIMGVLNMQVETALQGSPIYVKKFDKNQMRYLKKIEKKLDSD